MVTPAIVIRRASVTEAGDVFSLVEEFYEAASVVARDDRTAIVRDYVQNSNGGAAWLAYSGKEAAGCVLYHPLSTVTAAGEIKRLYVRPPFRRRGIAQELLNAVEGFASERGDGSLYLDTNDSLTAALAFYRRNGYEECPRP